MYFDSMGIPTIGIGFNLQRSDAKTALVTAGVAIDQVDDVMDGKVGLTPAQISKLFAYSFAPIVSEARSAFPTGIFDSMSDARRFAVCDMVFNLGFGGFMSFNTSRDMLAQAQESKDEGHVDAHNQFIAAAQHLTGTDWYTQVGNRAKRDCSMLQQGVWCNPLLDGSDIL